MGIELRQRRQHRAGAAGGQELGQVGADLVPGGQLARQRARRVLDGQEPSLLRKLEVLQVVELCQFRCPPRLY